MYNTSNLNSMKRIVYMLAVLFYGTSLFAQDKPFDIEHAPAPLFRCPIYDGPTDPTLEWNTERQEWWMFYTQRRANVPNLQEVACVYGSKVGIAATKNNGKNWYYVGTANLPEPMQGQSTFWAPDVFKHKDTYYMIVTFIPGIHPFWGGDARLLQKQGSDELGSGGGNRRYTWLYRRFGVSDAGRNMEDVVQDPRFQDEYGCEQGFDDLEGNRQM